MNTETAPREYNQWHHQVHGDESLDVLRLAPWHESALKLAPDLTGRHVLEVGCGAGDFSIALARRGAVVTGVDVSSRAIEIANEKKAVHGQGVTFRVADAQSLPFEASSFDVLFSCECLEHVPDPGSMISELHRVLKPGGALILTTENYSNAMALLWFKCWLTKRPFNSGAGVQPIEHFFVHWRIRSMLRRAGFEVTAQMGTHHVFLILPRMHPHTFVKESFRSRAMSRFFRPIARHMSFRATKLSR